MKLFQIGLFCSVSSASLFVSGCGAIEQRIRLPSDAPDLKESVVLITYGGQPGHSTGFFIESGQDFCTVLTVAHALPQDQEIKLTTFENQLFDAAEVSYAADIDLAIAAFDAGSGAGCPFPALKIGNSSRLKVGDFVRVAGYPERAGTDRLALQRPSGEITNIEIPPLPNGYSISYDITTVGGMSGGPVLNEAGEVIAVHGLTDIELVSLGQSQQNNLSNDQIDTIDAAEERTQELTRINHFKWAVPIQTFQSQRSTLLSSIEAFFQQANAFLEEADQLRNDGKHEEALVAYDKVLNVNPDQSSAWFGKGFSLDKLGRYEEAIEAYNKAIEIDPEDHASWNNRGISLSGLERYEEAIESYDKAIEIDPEFALAWNNRGNSLRGLERYEEAIESYDKAIEIDPENAFAWNNRGWSLENLGRDEDALASYAKAIELDPDFSTPANNRKRLLEEMLEEID